MTVNVGTADRLVRLALGAVLILLPFVTSSLSLWESSVAMVGVPGVGLVLALTALIRFCPIYRVFGLRTCRASS